MDKILEIVKWLLENYALYIAAINAVLVAMIALCLLIPGDEPENFLRKLVEFLAKFSNKPSDGKKE